MSTLRLGAYKLPAAEVVLVQTLFRLYAHGDAFRWTFVTAPPYDALLADGTTDEGMSPAVDAMAKAVLRLTRMNSGQAPNTLERPIRADRLQDWLKSTEHDLPQTRPATLIEEATQPDAVEAEATTPAAPINPVRFKLRRWPPAVLLRSDPNRIRMATLSTPDQTTAPSWARAAPECRWWVRPRICWSRARASSSDFALDTSPPSKLRV